jgi:transposase
VRDGAANSAIPVRHQRRAVGPDRAAVAGGQHGRPAGEAPPPGTRGRNLVRGRTGCSWRQLPADLPPWQTVYWNFVRWEQVRLTEKILPVVRAQLRVAEGRDPEPSAGLIDSQSVKGADTVGRESRGYDAGKKINSRERFIVADTLGLLLTVVVLTAGVQDRDGAKPVLLETYLRTRVRFVFADGGFAGPAAAVGTDPAARHPAHRAQASRATGFRGDPAPVGGRADLRLADRAPPPGRDYERDPAVSEVMIRWAAINTITRRIARGHPAARQRRRTFPSRRSIFSNTF